MTTYSKWSGATARTANPALANAYGQVDWPSNSGTSGAGSSPQRAAYIRLKKFGGPGGETSVGDGKWVPMNQGIPSDLSGDGQETNDNLHYLTMAAQFPGGAPNNVAFWSRFTIDLQTAEADAVGMDPSEAAYAIYELRFFFDSTEISATNISLSWHSTTGGDATPITTQTVHIDASSQPFAKITVDLLTGHLIDCDDMIL